MSAEAVFLGRDVTICCLKWQYFTRKPQKSLAKLPLHSRIRASRFPGDENVDYKQLGLFSMKRVIADAVLRAEMLAPTALELEEGILIKQEEMIRQSNLWHDPDKSHEILVKLADSVKAVATLKDIKYKVEEAKLISQLAEMEVVNYGLFKQAYIASVDVNKFLDQYETMRILKGPYDMEGACVIIQGGSRGINHQVWVEELLNMYLKWAEKIGNRASIVERHSSNSGLCSATIEFEFESAYGYLLGETGIHHKIMSRNGSAQHEENLQVRSAYVDVIPISLRTAFDLQINDKDLTVTLASSLGEGKCFTKPTVSLQHLPTSISVQSSGERSQFANKMKSLNRLKAKLLVIAAEQNVSDVNGIRRDTIVDAWKQEARRYIYHPCKLVQDLKTGIQLSDPNSVLEGNIEPLIAAHLSIRHSN